MAADVEGLMKELGLESTRTVVVGHSMGGMVACDVASRLRLRGLVLLGPVHPTPTMAGIFNQRIKDVMTSGYSVSGAGSIAADRAQMAWNLWATRYLTLQRAPALPSFIGPL